MDFNKKNGKLDFRNIKNTQFDSAQTNKMAFSEFNSAFRHLETNAILKDAYTHFSQTLNASGLPTYVEYFQASDNSIFTLTFPADVADSTVGDYIVIEEYLTKKTIALYAVVSGTGSAQRIVTGKHST